MSTPHSGQRSARAGAATQASQATQAMPAVNTAAPRPMPPPQTVAAGAVPGAAASPDGGPRTRKARLLVSRVDPWSVMKLGFLLSIALGVMLVVAATALWSVLDGMGIFDSVNRVVDQVVSTDGSSAFDLHQYVGRNRVIGIATMIALANVVLMTALATLGAFLYNLAASLVGGLHVTLSEDS